MTERLQAEGATLPSSLPARPAHPVVAVRPTVPFIAGLATGLLLDRLDPWVIESGGSTAETWLGASALSAGVALFVWALHVMARARTGIMLDQPAVQLVRTGPYRWSRNPQYVAFVVMYVGAALLFNTWWPIVMLPIVCVTVSVGAIAGEERYLAATFGRRFDEYRERVGRWI